MPCVCPEIMPELAIPPEKVEPSDTTMPLPLPPAESVPEFLIPPEKFEKLATPMPVQIVEVIVPELLMPPEKVEKPKAEMPVPLTPPPLAETVPELVIPPKNVDVKKTLMPCPNAELIAPALLMPPVKVGPLILMAVGLDTILLVLSIRIPRLVAFSVPLSTIAPLTVLPTMLMPVLAVIVPALDTLPPKLVTPNSVPPPVFRPI